MTTDFRRSAVSVLAAKISSPELKAVFSENLLFPLTVILLKPFPYIAPPSNLAALEMNKQSSITMSDYPEL